MRANSWLWAAVGAGVSIAALDLGLGAGPSLTGLLLICPLLAATQLDGARTAAVATGTVLLALVLHLYDSRLPDLGELVRLVGLILGAAYATWAAARRTAHDDALAAAAAVAQHAILHPASGRLGSLALSCRYRSAAPEALIGGDLYAFADTPYGPRLLIGDVRGNGLEAVRLSAAVIGYFRDCAYTHPEPSAVVTGIDQRLASSLSEEDFVTALLAEFTPGGVRLANCGHHPPLHLPATGPANLLPPAAATTPLGLHPTPGIRHVALEPGDRLLFYTDGLAEARNPAGVMLDVLGLADDCSGSHLDDAVDAVLTTLTRHTRGAVVDDVALVLVEFDPQHEYQSESVPRLSPSVTAGHSRR